jgi:hypothetical protein
MTPQNYLESIALELEKKYEDITLYNATCDENHILTVLVYYSTNKNYKKCEEWLFKRNKCIALHADYSGRYYYHICDFKSKVG